MSALLTEQDTASWLNMSVAALRRWRYEGRGPNFLKLGTAVRYDPGTVQKWLESCQSGGER